MDGYRTHKFNVFSCEEIGADAHLNKVRFDVVRFDCSCGELHYKVHDVAKDIWVDAVDHKEAVSIAEDAAKTVRVRSIN